jgi:hypothetical protein
MREPVRRNIPAAVPAQTDEAKALAQREQEALARREQDAFLGINRAAINHGEQLRMQLATARRTGTCVIEGCGKPTKNGSAVCSKAHSDEFVAISNADQRHLLRVGDCDRQYVEDARHQLALRQQQESDEAIIAAHLAHPDPRGHLLAERERLDRLINQRSSTLKAVEQRQHQIDQPEDRRRRSLQLLVERLNHLKPHETEERARTTDKLNDLKRAIQKDRDEWARLETQRQAMVEQRSEAKTALKLVQRAWRELRYRERDARVENSEGLTRYCIVCPRELYSANEERWCNEKCHRQYEALEDEILMAMNDAHFRICDSCNRRFTGGDLVKAFRDRDPDRTFPGGVDVCSLPCWNAQSVDADEPPTFFDKIVYVAPHGTVPSTLSPAGSTPVAAMTALDRYVAYLREVGSATDKVASEALGIPQGTLRRLRNEHPSQFTSEGPWGRKVYRLA